jgi:hypothetical protein
MEKIVFEVLIDIGFADICTNPDLAPINNKSLLSLLNDFEEGQWRRERFLAYVWDNIAETALSKKERESLLGAPLSSLKASAKNLRLTDKDERGKGSEISEILLYGIMKDYYHALPVVPKIFHKQNTKDNAKGADSVHIVLKDDMSDFSVWFGEAKFYKSLSNDAMDDIIESVKNSLDKDKIKKENSIITDLRDLDGFEMPDELRQKIYKLLDQDRSIDVIKPKLHIPILLLHQCGKTKSAKGMDENYIEKIKRKHIKKANDYFAKQVDALKDIVHKYEEIHFHLILFPVADKDAIVEEFLNLAAIYRK